MNMYNIQNADIGRSELKYHNVVFNIIIRIMIRINNW